MSTEPQRIIRHDLFQDGFVQKPDFLLGEGNPFRDNFNPDEVNIFG